MPKVSQISVSFASAPGDFAPPKDLMSVAPLTFARYTLRNRDKAGFGLNDFTYLSYEGGFITEDDKISIKFSDFTVKQNLTVNDKVFFKENVRVDSPQGFNKVINVKPLTNHAAFAATANDNDALIEGDWRKYMFEPGMIMLWSGTLESLRSELPFWRLCAPPDSGKTFWGTFVPNLIGKFIPGAIPETGTPATASNQTGYRTGNMGGHDFIRLTEPQMSKHKHNVKMVANDPAPIVSGTSTFAYGGGAHSESNNSAGANDNSNNDCAYEWALCSAACRCINCNGYGGSCSLTVCSSRYDTGRPSLNTSVIDSFSRQPFETATISIANAQTPKIKRQTEDTKGGQEYHENRPQFYALAYIIYVGPPN